MMRSIDQVLKRPLLTEKAISLKEAANKVVFEVHKDANKHEIKSAIESLFEVKVSDVRTMIFRGKIKRVGKQTGKRRNWKKAVVTFPEDVDLDIFGVATFDGAPPEEAES
ncbi:MAG: 50S ribosomal protein L23 [Myxococcales bacterium]|nr:50S ribosomal protein L23 [Myxococcales bacterium]